MLRYFTVNTVAELVCLVIALICLSKNQDKIWRSFIVFMFITVFTEMAGIHIKKVYHQPNAWLYNLLLLVQGFFYVRMFDHLLYSNRRSPVITFPAGLLCLLFVYECVSNTFFGATPNHKYYYYSTTNSVFAVVVVFYSLYYLYLILKADNYVTLSKSASFWWVAGALFFYFGSTTCNIFYSKLENIKIAPNRNVTYYIYNLLNIFLYSCWSYAFICKRWLDPNSKN